MEGTTATTCPPTISATCESQNPGTVSQRGSDEEDEPVVGTTAT